MADIKKLGAPHHFAASLGKPDPDLIETIEGLLARVKSGEVQGVAYCSIFSDGARDSDWDGCASAITQLGAITLLLADFTAAMRADERGV